MRALLSLLKNISNEYNNSGERSQPRESSCPRAKLRMNLIGDNGRIYTRTHRLALLSPPWLFSYIKKGISTKKDKKNRDQSISNNIYVRTRVEMILR